MAIISFYFELNPGANGEIVIGGLNGVLKEIRGMMFYYDAPDPVGAGQDTAFVMRFNSGSGYKEDKGFPLLFTKPITNVDTLSIEGNKFILASGVQRIINVMKKYSNEAIQLYFKNPHPVKKGACEIQLVMS